MPAYDIHPHSVDSAVLAPSEWWLDRGAAQELFRVFQQVHLPANILNGEVTRLGAVHGRGVVCAELIFLLTRLKLEPVEALSHWQRLLTHSEGLATRWGGIPSTFVLGF